MLLSRKIDTVNFCTPSRTYQRNVASLMLFYQWMLQLWYSFYYKMLKFWHFSIPVHCKSCAFLIIYYKSYKICIGPQWHPMFVMGQVGFMGKGNCSALNSLWFSIQNFLFPRLIAKPKLKSSVCSTICS